MIKLIFKIFLACILLFFFGIVILFFVGSSSDIETSEYLEISEYSGAQRTNSDTITIMTYNFGYASGMTNNQSVRTSELLFNTNVDKAIQLIKENKIDILAMQEVDFDSDRSYNQNQVKVLSEGCGFGNSAQTSNWDKKYVPFPYWPPSVQFGKIHSGQAILSKFPFTSHERIELERPKNNPFYYDAFYLDRLIQIAKIKIDSIELVVLNVHLEAFDKETRQKQSEVVSEYYNQYAKDYPVILLGDFNATIEKKDQDITIPTIKGGNDIRSCITDSVYYLSPSKFFTYSSENPDRMIDYIFYNGSRISLVEARVVKQAGDISDHLPVLMKFVIINNNN